jgi:hypothetical protein
VEQVFEIREKRRRTRQQIREALCCLGADRRVLNAEEPCERYSSKPNDLRIGGCDVNIQRPIRNFRGSIGEFCSTICKPARPSQIPIRDRQEKKPLS